MPYFTKLYQADLPHRAKLVYIYLHDRMDSEKKALGETYHFAIVMRDIARLEKEIRKANYTIGKFLAEEK